MSVQSRLKRMLGNTMVRALTLSAAVATLLSSAPVGAQTTLPIERYRAAIDDKGTATVEGADVVDPWKWQLGYVLNYSRNPLLLQQDGKTTASLIENRLAGDLLFTIGVFDNISVGLDLPMTLFQNGDSSRATEAGLPAQALAATGIGDLKLVPKWRFFGLPEGVFSAAFIPTVTFPTATGLRFGDQSGVDYGGSYLGEGPGRFAFIPELALSSNFMGMRLAANVSYRFRGDVKFTDDVTITPELGYRLGVGYDLADVVPSLHEMLIFTELFGATSHTNPFGLVDSSKQIATLLSNPMELALGARYAPQPGLKMEFGAAVGILPGYGTPDFRLFAGVRYAPTVLDEDGDGVPDDRDPCPTEPEDVDGFRDSDGCPDLDNDEDGVPDTTDACADEKEDVDGFKDDDGCPEIDNDEDGVLDADDKCPTEKGDAANNGCPIVDTDGDTVPDADDLCPEEAGPVARKGCPLHDKDADGIEDASDACPEKPGPAERKGCPIGDKDGDGVIDEEDKCPDVFGIAARKGCPIPDKDGDGIEDKMDECPTKAGAPMHKGCPDTDGDGLRDKDDTCPTEAGAKSLGGCPDKDSDGIPDNKDKCPTEPETINGIKDTDGCPDKGKVKVKVTKDKIEILDKVFFKTGSATIQRKSFKLLNQVAQVLKANPQIKHIRIEGHTDSAGNDKRNKRLSEKRAASVLRYLLKKGVESERLESQGFGEERPIDTNKTRAGRANNRRVEFVIVDK